MTHVGHKRQTNQDSLVVDEELALYAVADGMGGYSGGDVASALAIQSLQDFLKTAVKEKDFFPDTYLIEAFKESNARVFAKSQENNGELAGMGTTLTACFIWKNKAFFGNVGDSRAYLFRDPYLWRITEDHSVLNSQIRKGLIDEGSDVATYSNVITRSIGFFPDVQVDLFQRDLKKGDLFLLCSDGLNEISDQEICSLARKYPSEEWPEQCVKRVLEGEGNDNVSIVVVAP